MKKFAWGFVIGLLLLPVWGWAYFRFGYAPVATAASPMPFEKELAHAALHARIEKEAPKTVPIPSTEENYAAGVKVYRTQCAVCHGLSGQEPSPTAKGMFPEPPQLLKGTGVTDDPAGETYWKVRNGIRLTGMPAYVGSLSENQMWQVSIVLANADKLPPSALAKLKLPPTTE